MRGGVRTRPRLPLVSAYQCYCNGISEKRQVFGYDFSHVVIRKPAEKHFRLSFRLPSKLSL